MAVSDTVERENYVKLLAHFWFVLMMQVLRCSVALPIGVRETRIMAVSDTV